MIESLINESEKTMFTYSNDSLSHAARAIIDNIARNLDRQAFLLDVLDAIVHASDSNVAIDILKYRFDSDFFDYENIDSLQNYANDESVTNQYFLDNIAKYIEESYQFILFCFVDRTSEIEDEINATFFDCATFSHMFSERVA